MVNLILLGDPDGGAFADALCGVLSRRFSVAYADAPAQNPDFVLTEQHSLNGSSSGIVLCKNEFTYPAVRDSCPHVAAGVLQTDNAAAARILRQLKAPTISCGMAATDTLTFSSFTEESAVVCLQRSIPTLDGTITGPAEAPLAFSRQYDSYILMCAVSVLLLCGGWELLRELPL